MALDLANLYLTAAAENFQQKCWSAVWYVAADKAADPNADQPAKDWAQKFFSDRLNMTPRQMAMHMLQHEPLLDGGINATDQQFKDAASSQVSSFIRIG